MQIAEQLLKGRGVYFAIQNPSRFTLVLFAENLLLRMRRICQQLPYAPSRHANTLPMVVSGSISVLAC